MSSVQTKRTESKGKEKRVPWPRTEQEVAPPKPSRPREDWRAYCDRRHQECCQHAAALEYLLKKYPDQRTWLEKHGFDTAELIQSLRWYPTEELAALEGSQGTARPAQQDKLRLRTKENFDRIQENLLRLLPLVREVQEGIEGASSAASTSSHSGSSGRGSKLHRTKMESKYSSIAPVQTRWEF